MLHREFACHICRISVASYETYQNHLRGKDHIKRVNNQTKYDNEQERKVDVVIPKDNATSIANKSRAELEDLRRTKANLQRTYQDMLKKELDCRRNHEGGLNEKLSKELSAKEQELASLKRLFAEKERNVAKKSRTCNVKSENLANLDHEDFKDDKKLIKKERQIITKEEYRENERKSENYITLD